MSILNTRDDDFVRGQYDLVDNLRERHMLKRKAFYDLHIKPGMDRMRSLCTTRKELSAMIKKEMAETLAKVTKRAHELGRGV